MSLRAPTPLRSTPSSAPLEAMIAKKQSDIEDLLAQNRTLEHTITKLRQALAEEQDRGKEAVAALHQRWKEERAEWREGCDSLQSAYRAAHLHTAIDLEKERMAVIVEREKTRAERLAKAQRDYRLLTFQQRESELEDRISELEWELKDSKADHEDELRELEEQLAGKAGVLEARCVDLAAQLRETSDELAAALKEKEKAEDALSKLRVEHTTLQATSSSTVTNLERTTLHLEGLKSSHAELETKHAEVERTVADLRRQLDKWRNLESREGAEMEALRRERINLEVRVKELDTKLEEAETTARHTEAAHEKLSKKLEKYKDALDEHKKAIDEAHEETDQAEANANAANQRLREAEEQIQTLKAQLERQQLALRNTAGSQTLKQSGRASATDGQGRASAYEIEGVLAESPSPPPLSSLPPKSKSRPSPKPAGRSGMPANRTMEKSDEEESMDTNKGEHSKKTKKAGRGTAKSKAKKSEDAEEEDDAGAAQPKNKGKRKARPADGDSDDDEVPKKRERKKRAVAEDNDEEPPAKPKPKPKARTNSKTAAETAKSTGRTLSKSAQSRANASASASMTTGDMGEDVATTPKKKKRKINIFSTAQTTSFDWDQLPKPGGGLDIPTELSPVKEGTIPQKSVFGKTGSLLGSFGSYGSRR